MDELALCARVQAVGRLLHRFDAQPELHHRREQRSGAGLQQPRAATDAFAGWVFDRGHGGFGGFLQRRGLAEGHRRCRGCSPGAVGDQAGRPPFGAGVIQQRHAEMKFAGLMPPGPRQRAGAPQPGLRRGTDDGGLREQFVGDERGL